LVLSVQVVLQGLLHATNHVAIVAHLISQAFYVPVDVGACRQHRVPAVDGKRGIVRWW
jgi:hypothetical protein